MEDKNLNTFLAEINEILKDLESIERSVRITGTNSPFFKNQVPGSKSVSEENIEKINTLKADFETSLQSKQKNIAALEEYAREEPSNTYQSTVYNNSSKKTQNPYIGQLDENARLCDEIRAKIQKATKICYSIQTMVNQDAMNVAQRESQMQDAEEIDLKAIYRPFFEMQKQTDLAGGNDIAAAIKANIRLGMEWQRQASQDENQDSQEFYLNHASKHYVTALNLARDLNNPQTVSGIIKLLKNIGRDENGESGSVIKSV